MTWIRAKTTGESLHTLYNHCSIAAASRQRLGSRRPRRSIAAASQSPTTLVHQLASWIFFCPAFPCSHDLTPESVGVMIRFLYGIQPDITADNARALLFTSAYFGVPTLLSR